MDGLQLAPGVTLAVDNSMTLSGPSGAPSYGMPPTSDTLGYLGLPLNKQTGNYVLALTDQGGIVDCENVGAQSVTIPANATVPFPYSPAATISGDNFGTTAVTIVPATGVTLTWLPSGTSGLAGAGTRTIAPFGFWTIYQRALNNWVIVGGGIT